MTRKLRTDGFLTDRGSGGSWLREVLLLLLVLFSASAIHGQTVLHPPGFGTMPEAWWVSSPATTPQPRVRVSWPTASLGHGRGPETGYELQRQYRTWGGGKWVPGIPWKTSDPWEDLADTEEENPKAWGTSWGDIKRVYRKDNDLSREFIDQSIHKDLLKNRKKAIHVSYRVRPIQVRDDSRTLEGGWSRWSMPITWEPPLTVKLDKPVVEALSRSSVRVRWEPPKISKRTPITGYYVYHAPEDCRLNQNFRFSCGGTWGATYFAVAQRNSEGERNGNVATFSGIAASAIISGLDPSIKYRFWVTASGFYEEAETPPSDPSDIVSLETVEMGNVPGLVVKAVNSSAIELSWGLPTPTGSGIASYLIKRREDGGKWLEVPHPATSRTKVDSGLTVGSEYEYRVKAKGSAGDLSTDWADSAKVILNFLPGMVEEPVAEVVDRNTLRVRWKKPVNRGTPLTRYEVQRSTTIKTGKRAGDAGAWESAGVIQSLPLATQLIDDGLDIDVNVTYQVRAVNQLGEGAWSPNSYPAAPVDLDTRPGAVENLRASAGPRSVKLVWYTPKWAGTPGSAVRSYQIEVRPDGGSWTRVPGAFRTKQVSYAPYDSDLVDIGSEVDDAVKERRDQEGYRATRITGLTASVVHFFRVRAVNPAGVGPWSSDVQAIPLVVQAVHVEKLLIPRFGLKEINGTATVDVTVHFNLPVENFTADDLTVVGGTVESVTSVDGLLWTVKVRLNKGGGQVLYVSIKEMSVSLRENPNKLGPSRLVAEMGGSDVDYPVVTLVMNRPDAIRVALAHAGPNVAGMYVGNNAEIPVKFRFSEEVTGFDNSDVAISGGGSLSTIVKSSTNPRLYTATWTIAANQPLLDQKLSVTTIQNGQPAFTDHAGNEPYPGAILPLRATLDNESPQSAKFLINCIQNLGRNECTAVLVFSEPVGNFGVDNLAVTGGKIIRGPHPVGKCAVFAWGPNVGLGTDPLEYYFLYDVIIQQDRPGALRIDIDDEVTDVVGNKLQLNVFDWENTGDEAWTPPWEVKFTHRVESENSIRLLVRKIKGVDSALKYRLYRREESAGPNQRQKIWEYSPDDNQASSYLDGNLITGTSYVYDLEVTTLEVSDTEAGTYLYRLRGTTTAATIDPPVAQIVNGTSVRMTWKASANQAVTEYVLQRRGKNAGSWGEWASVADYGGKAVTYLDTGLTSGTEYEYRVQARNLEGEVVAWSSAVAVTLPDAPVLGVTFDPEAHAIITDVDTNIVLTFSEAVRQVNGQALNAAAASRAVTLAQVGDAQNTDLATAAAVSWNAQNWRITINPANSLTSGEQYTTTLLANTVEDLQGNAIDSAQRATFTVDADPPQVIFDPANGRVTPDVDTDVVLSFDEAVRQASGSALTSNAAAAAVTLVRADDTQNTDLATAATVSWNARAGRITINPASSLTSGKQYTVTLLANTVEDLQGNEIDSDKSATFTPAPAPGKPDNLDAAPRHESVKLTWDDPSNATITRWEYHYKTSASYGNWTPIPNSNDTTTSHTVSSLSNGTVHTFQVRAVNQSGDGAASDEVSATPAPTPAKPVVKAAARPLSVDLAWPKSSDATIDKWQYRSGTASGSYGAWTDIPSSTRDTVSHTVAPLNNGQVYYFQVRAVNPSGDGAASDEVSATPAPAPAKPVVTAVGRHLSVDLTWDDPDDTTITRWQYRSREASDSYGSWAQISNSASTVSHTVSYLTNGTEYFFQVRATNPSGDGAASDEVSATPAPVPAKPVVTATARHESVDLTWLKSSDTTITRWEYRSKAASGDYRDWTQISTDASTVSHKVTSLNNGAAYTFQVRAVNSSGGGVASEEVSATPAPVPAKPVVTATARHLSVDLTWLKSSDTTITRWEYRSKAASGDYRDWTQISTDASTVSHKVTSLNNGAAYTFQVRAVNPSGDGVASEEVSATPAPVPAKPVRFAAASRHQSVLLSWTDPSDATITQWQYRSKVASADYGDWTDIPNSRADTTSYTVPNLVNGTVYIFRVRAVNSSGDGAKSVAASATPAPVPAKPAGFTATPGDRQVVLSWRDPSDSTIIKWEYRSKTTGDYGDWTQISTGASTTSYTVASLNNGTEYTFQVRASNASGAGEASDAKSATPAPPVPAQPVVTAVAGDGQVKLTWTDLSDTTITKWEYRYKVKTASVEGSWTEFSTSASATTYTVPSLTNGTEYTFQVRASNASGAGTASEADDATPVGAPGVPDAPKLVPGDGQLTVTWSEPTDTGGTAITDYDVEYRPGTSGDWINHTHDGAGTSATIASLTDGTSYQVRVRAENSVGDGGWSDAASATPVPVPAQPVVTAAAGDGQVKLTWTDLSDTTITKWEYRYKVKTASVEGSWTEFSTSRPVGAPGAPPRTRSPR